MSDEKVILSTTSKRKSWTRKKWKEKRDEILNEDAVCSYCGTKKNLVIHHPPNETIKNKARFLRKEIIKDFEIFDKVEREKFREKVKEKYQSRSKFHRHKSHPYYHLIKTGHTKSVDLSELEYRINKNQYYHDLQLHRSKNFFQWLKDTNREIEYQETYDQAVENYLSMNGIIILCNRCHFAVHKGMNLCPICHQKYKKFQYATCFDCLYREKILKFPEGTLEFFSEMHKAILLGVSL